MSVCFGRKQPITASDYRLKADGLVGTKLVSQRLESIIKLRAAHMPHSGAATPDDETSPWKFRIAVNYSALRSGAAPEQRQNQNYAQA